MTKIAIVSHYAPSLVNFRGELIKTMVASGHQVIALGPEEGFESELAALGAEYRQIPLWRTGTNPLQEVGTLFSLIKLLRVIKPEVVLSYAIKPVIYGSLAAWLAGVRNIYSMITGLGYLFTGKSTRQRILYRLVYPLYKAALSKNKVVFFQNPDDLSLFRDLKLVSSKQKQVIINGSGVNVSHFAYTPAPAEPLSFLLMARLIWDKGIAEYVTAARNLKKRYPQVSFKLLGPYDSNPTSIKPTDIEKWENEGIIDYLGETRDVRPYLVRASVFVLPSYREGTPRSVLEAMSIGRPIITTDAPGCRETVRDGVNGFLVPVKDAVALEKAMERFILKPELIQNFGLESRKIAEAKYDVRKVNKVIIEAMGLL
ncbi:glycosyltransferase family 4 protein [Neomoorella humiferrea]|uniref:glycosyltransferase family 4 protein n=1 Tax=Neomoorella humiferrea TaxID=676965 RepID=UPI003D8DAC8E